MQSIGYRLLVCLLRQRLSNVVKVCLFVNQTLDKGCVFLEGTASKSFVSILQYLFNLLVELGNIHVYLMHIALGLEDARQLLN